MFSDQVIEIGWIEPERLMLSVRQRNSVSRPCFMLHDLETVDHREQRSLACDPTIAAITLADEDGGVFPGHGWLRHILLAVAAKRKWCTGLVELDRRIPERVACRLGAANSAPNPNVGCRSERGIANIALASDAALEARASKRVSLTRAGSRPQVTSVSVGGCYRTFFGIGVRGLVGGR